MKKKILNVLIAEERTSEYCTSKEIENREVYFNDFIIIDEKLKISEESNVDLKSEVRSCLSDNKLKFYKLPRIELKRFGGKLFNWLPFWSQFQKIQDVIDLQ